MAVVLLHQSHLLLPQVQPLQLQSVLPLLLHLLRVSLLPVLFPHLSPPVRVDHHQALFLLQFLPLLL